MSSSSRNFETPESPEYDWNFARKSNFLLSSVQLQELRVLTSYQFTFMYFSSRNIIIASISKTFYDLDFSYLLKM